MALLDALLAGVILIARAPSWVFPSGWLVATEGRFSTESLGACSPVQRLCNCVGCGLLSMTCMGVCVCGAQSDLKAKMMGLEKDPRVVLQVLGVKVEGHPPTNEQLAAGYKRALVQVGVCFYRPTLSFQSTEKHVLSLQLISHSKRIRCDCVAPPYPHANPRPRSQP
jgi:hypothetical protein